MSIKGDRLERKDHIRSTSPIPASQLFSSPADSIHSINVYRKGTHERMNQMVWLWAIALFTIGVFGTMQEDVPRINRQRSGKPPHRRIYDPVSAKYYYIVSKGDLVDDPNQTSGNTKSNETAVTVRSDGSPLSRCPTCPPPGTVPTWPTEMTTQPTPHTPPTYTWPTVTRTTPPTPPTYTWPTMPPTAPPTPPTYTWPTMTPPPTHTPTPPPTHTPTPPYCTPIPPLPSQPTLPSITYSSNCDYCDHDLYTLTCVHTPFDCAARCASDHRCTHFTYIANLKGGTCRLKRSVGSGGGWASVVPAPSPYICGYIPKRAYNVLQLNICVGLDILFQPNKK